MILATVTMALPPQKRDEALRIFKSVAELCRDDPDCLRCSLYRDLQDNKVLVLQEIWRTEEAMDLHLCSEEYRNVLLVLEMALKQPEIRFDIISSSTGLETIEKARRQAR